LAVTEKLTAAGRAVESRRADRLFEDPHPTIAPRTLFYDDVVAKAIGDGISQVVMLAAGMDTRASPAAAGRGDRVRTRPARAA
jgi:O-methyltransferase involved in polyketide biosynthesis